MTDPPPGSPSDTHQLYYYLWLVRDGLLGPTPLFRDPYQFNVGGSRGSLLETFPPLSIPFLLLSVFGTDAADNLLVLLSFPLSGLGAWLLVRRLGVQEASAAASALAFALAPERLAALFFGQPAGFVVGLVPLALWGLDSALTTGSPWGGIVGGGALFALATSEPHYAYLTGGPS